MEVPTIFVSGRSFRTKRAYTISDYTSNMFNMEYKPFRDHAVLQFGAHKTKPAGERSMVPKPQEAASVAGKFTVGGLSNYQVCKYYLEVNIHKTQHINNTYWRWELKYIDRTCFWLF